MQSLGHLLGNLQHLALASLTNEAAALVAGENVRELGLFSMTSESVVPENPAAIADACPNKIGLRVYLKSTFQCFWTFATLPNIQFITFAGPMKINEQEKRKMVELLCTKIFTRIRIYGVVFSPKDIRDILRYQGESLEYYGLSIRCNNRVPENTAVVSAVCVAAIRWSPNIRRILAVVGYGHSSEQNLFPYWERSSDDEVIKRMMRVRIWKRCSASISLHLTPELCHGTVS